jgi:hypothetical protein
MTAVFRTLLGWFSGGSALAALASIVLAVCAVVFGLLYRRYLGILGADRSKAAERQAYDALRHSLAHGNIVARLYAERLTRFLDWIDRFFGDAGIADRTLFPHAFWLKTPAPLWTAPAFELCLLFALIYPTATIFIIWAISGHVGPAELALHLDTSLPAWQRWSAAALALLSVSAVWAATRRRGWRRLIRIVASIAAFVAAMAISVATARAMIIAAPQPAPSAGYFRRVASVTAISINVVGPRAIAITVVLLATIGVTVTVALFGAAMGAIRRSSQTGGHRREGVLLSVIVITMASACYGTAMWLAPSQTWQILGPLLLFLGLLTLLNAPFDWGSLGLTRALLRRGLELGGWWPYAFALLDAAIAAVIIAGLALTMVVGVQAFDASAVHGGGAPVLPLEPLFNGIAAQPRAPEYWWIYALLLSTMIPSLVNLVIGGASLVRGLPGVPSILLRFMPDKGGVLKWDRHWIAAVLTTQVAAGAALGMAAQVFLVVGIIGYVMPFFGLELLDMARDVAAFNLPARVGQLFGVSL